MTHPSVVVVGGGIAGLVAAIYAARGGARVTLLERRSGVGGRARTRDEGGFRFNYGPHALYRAATGAEVLRELGLEIAGGDPTLRGARALRGGRTHWLPAGPGSLLGTRLLGPAEKWEVGRWLARLPGYDAELQRGRTLAEFADAELRQAGSRELVFALVRLAAYIHAPGQICAAAALGQLARALGGVRYLDGGWQSLVDALGRYARSRGVEVRTGAQVRRLTHGASVKGVELAGGGQLEADRVVLAVDTDTALRLLEGPEALGSALRDAIPVRAASLDVGLERLPRPARWFALGIDRPVYFSVHSAHADLAPRDGAVLHVSRYLAPGEAPSRAALGEELEDVLDRMQPGWRAHCRSARLGTDLRVASWLPDAARGGLAGRPRADAAGVDGLWLAGEWVGPEGMLADASFASGRAAGEAAAQR